MERETGTGRTRLRAVDEVGAGAAASRVVERVDADVRAREVAVGRVAGVAEVAADLARAVVAERVTVGRDVAGDAGAGRARGEGRDALVALLSEAAVAGVRARAAVADVGRVGRAERGAVLAHAVCGPRARCQHAFPLRIRHGLSSREQQRRTGAAADATRDGGELGALHDGRRLALEHGALLERLGGVGAASDGARGRDVAGGNGVTADDACEEQKRALARKEVSSAAPRTRS